MKKIILVALTVFSAFLGERAIAQTASDNKLKFEAGYNVSLPTGSFKKEFIDKSSFRGGYAGVNYTLNPQFALGLNVGFQSFNQRYDRQTYKLEDNQTVSAVVTNQIDLIPVLIKGTFHPLGNSAAKVQPYVAAGGGVNVVNYGQYLGEFGGTEFSTSLALQGGAGISIPFGRTNASAFKIGANYNYVAYKKNGLDNLNSVSFNAGFTIPLK